MYRPDFTFAIPNFDQISVVQLPRFVQGLSIRFKLELLAPNDMAGAVEEVEPVPNHCRIVTNEGFGV